MRDEFGGRPGREMEEDWPGDDAESAISSICGENGIPDGGEAVTDVSMLDGRWKVVLYDSTSDDLPAYYMGEVSREATGEAETLFIGGKIVGTYHMAVLTGVEAGGDVNPHGSAALVLEEQLVNIAL